MLIEFTVGNYRSFAEPAMLSMVATSAKSKNKELDAATTFQLPGQPKLLTSAAIYGANASGKSNFVRALRFMRQFVIRSTGNTSAVGAGDVEPFRLRTDTLGRPSHFEAAFILDGKRYRYGFDVDRERVTAEWLYYVPAARETRLFERRAQEFVLAESFREGENIQDKTRPNALFLSVVAEFNGPLSLRLVQWFRALGIQSGLNDAALRRVTERRLQQPADAQRIVDLVRRLDVGIQDIRIVDEYVLLIHAKYDEAGNIVGDETFALDQHESEGTKKLFALAGYLVDVLQRGSVLIVDELDARLHPIVTREIVRLFNSAGSNPNHAQIIFTTQDTNLLDNDLLRRDQIWFVEKDSKGASHLYSLAEFKGVRNDLALERHYIQGRFGAVPYLGDLAAALAEDEGSDGRSTRPRQQ